MNDAPHHEKYCLSLFRVICGLGWGCSSVFHRQRYSFIILLFFITTNKRRQQQRQQLCIQNLYIQDWMNLDMSAVTDRRNPNNDNHPDHDDHDYDYDDDDDDNRVVLHFDLDAFYVCCEREVNSQLRHVPVAVSQYNPYGTLQDKPAADIHARWVVRGIHNNNNSETKEVTEIENDLNTDPQQQQQQQQQQQHSQVPPQDTNGSLIAVSYEARASGVKRGQRGKDACQACPSLNIVQVPVKHGKADLTIYRTASKRVMSVLRDAIRGIIMEGVDRTDDKRDGAISQASPSNHDNDGIIMEIASIDEVYMDITRLANRIVEQVLAEEPSSGTARCNSGGTEDFLWPKIVETAGRCTTIGGIEVLSEAAQAVNNLDKNELRRGSHVQVLDSNTNHNNQTVDEGSRAWWYRPLSCFSVVQLRLVCGAYIAARARRMVQTSFDDGCFTLSAGISTNKTLAKLASGLKKPNRQTLIYRDARVLQKLFHPLPLGRIRGLGGKFGISIAEQFHIETVGQLAEISRPQLEQMVPKSAQFLFDISRGLCTEPVTPRTKPKSIECSKTFRGQLAIHVEDTKRLQKWIGELCSELQERLQQDNDEYSRITASIKVSVQFHFQRSFLSKQMRAPRNLSSYHKTASDMIRSLIETTQKKLSGAEAKKLKITGMGIGGMQFVDVAEGSSSILSFATAKESSSPSKACAPGQSRTTNGLKRFVAEPKRTGVELWLKQSQQNSSDDPHPKRAKTASTDSSDISLPKSLSATATSKNESQAMTLPSMEEVDLEVLNALPKDLQRQIIGDIRYQQSQRKVKSKKTSIQSFFAPKKST